jgi:GNAT superfamily N-acetyltransferase
LLRQPDKQASSGPNGVTDDGADATQAMTTVSGVDAERAFEVSMLIDEHHPRGSYYFLQFMGVEPDGHGRGIGSALLARVLERCDREGVPAYLDAASPHNKRLYERHGLRAGGEYSPEGGAPLWPRWRGPGA